MPLDKDQIDQKLAQLEEYIAQIKSLGHAAVCGREAGDPTGAGLMGVKIHQRERLASGGRAVGDRGGVKGCPSCGLNVS